VNTLYYGDNLDILRRHIADGSVDLVYLDPPFKSNQDYNVLFAERDGTLAAAQIKAFEDTWRWDRTAAEAYQEVVERGGGVSRALQAFRTLLGDSDMLAYLSMMAPRLTELHRVLNPSGSLFLHCDPTASHYLKVLLDAVFGPVNFRNEIVWRRTGAHGPRRSFGPIHDTILFYTRSDAYFFNIVRQPYMRGHVETRYRRAPDGRLKFVTGGNILTGAGATRGESGQPWRGFDPSAKGRHWAIPGDLAEMMPPDFQELGVLAKLDALYAAGLIEIKDGAEWPHPVRYLKPGDGQPLTDIWASQPYTGKWRQDVIGTVYESDDDIDYDVQWLGRRDPERLGYPTQKPEGLLDRIINSSCPERGVVLDPFCGCGTTIAAAQRLGRQWIGVDITHLAITLIRHRLRDTYGDAIGATYQVIGEPVSLPDAETLAADDPYQFQWWALGLVGARPVEQKKGADKGIDGRLYFHDEGQGGKTKQIVLSVKAGHTNVAHVRDLRGVLDREKAEIGVLITMQEPTQPMRAEAAGAGFYKSPWGQQYPRLQLLTVAELLDGKRIDYPPPTQTNVTFKKAPRAKPEEAEQMGLVAEEKAQYPAKRGRRR
jgi:DNA modification methylase